MGSIDLSPSPPVPEDFVFPDQGEFFLLRPTEHPGFPEARKLDGLLVEGRAAEFPVEYPESGPAGPVHELLGIHVRDFLYHLNFSRLESEVRLLHSYAKEWNYIDELCWEALLDAAFYVGHHAKAYEVCSHYARNGGYPLIRTALWLRRNLGLPPMDARTVHSFTGTGRGGRGRSVDLDWKKADLLLLDQQQRWKSSLAEQLFPKSPPDDPFAIPDIDRYLPDWLSGADRRRLLEGHHKQLAAEPDNRARLFVTLGCAHRLLRPGLPGTRLQERLFDSIIRTMCGDPLAHLDPFWAQRPTSSFWEANLFFELREAFPGLEVQWHAQPEWLGRQHFDIFLPSHNIAIEYQGEPHTKAIAAWGGATGLRERQMRDKLKRLKCHENGCKLIEVQANQSPLTVLRQVGRLIRRTPKETRWVGIEKLLNGSDARREPAAWDPYQDNVEGLANHVKSRRKRGESTLALD